MERLVGLELIEKSLVPEEPQLGELERANARLPVEAAIGRDVLLGVPERAAVGWVDGHRAVVAPAGQCAGLGASADDDTGLALRIWFSGIAHEATRVADAGCIELLELL